MHTFTQFDAKSNYHLQEAVDLLNDVAASVPEAFPYSFNMMDAYFAMVLIYRHTAKKITLQDLQDALEKTQERLKQKGLHPAETRELRSSVQQYNFVITYLS